MTEKNEIDLIDSTIPYSSLVVIFVGVIILLSGVVFVYFPPLQPITAGIGIFALGLALISFGLTQRSNFNSRLNTVAFKEQLQRIEDKIDKK